MASPTQAVRSRSDQMIGFAVSAVSAGMADTAVVLSAADVMFAAVAVTVSDESSVSPSVELPVAEMDQLIKGIQNGGEVFSDF